MDYLALWKVFEELMTELKKKGVKISDETMKRLRSTRATINIYKADPSYGQTSELLMSYLTDLEMELMTHAEQDIGMEYANAWLKKISAARKAEPGEGGLDRGFPKGVPRSDYWIRFTVGETIPGDELRAMASESGLSIKEESQDHVIIHGEQSKVKQLVKQLTEKQRERKDRG